MKNQVYYCVILLFFCFSDVSSQATETIHPPLQGGSELYFNTRKHNVQNTPPRTLLNPELTSQQKKWDISLAQHGVIHGSSIPQNEKDSIKQAGDLLRRNKEFHLRGNPQVDDLMEGSLTTPNINMNFKGNAYDYWAPCDNSIAVSDDGYVVSVINISILFADENGQIIREENLDDFLSTLNLNGGYFDPRVIYDPEEDKFIMVVLNGNTPATSTIVIGFSTTSNPEDSWWFYTFSGDPGGGGLWFDFPSIGLSTDDLYISGNQFTPENAFARTLIYQLYKGPGFRGETLNGLHWEDVRDAHGNADFTVVPISYGFDGSAGPGIYFISTNAAGGTEAMLYYTDANSQNNPSLYAYSATIPNYYMPFDGYMLGSEDKLETNDCRTLSGFYADGTIHFVFNNRGDDLHGKINYCRLNTADLTQNTLTFGLQPYEYAYPCVAPFAISETDKSVLIGFVRTSSLIYPELRIAMVDHDMNYLGSSLVKEGEGYVDFSAATSERWGDYCGISRRHTENGAEVWVAGSYGENEDNGDVNVLSTWIAQIKDTPTATTSEETKNQFAVYPNPVTTGRVNVEFELNASAEYSFFVVDERGAVVKNLLFRRVKEGLNNFSFNTEPLLPGLYFLVIRDQHGGLLKSVQFAVL